MKKVALIISAIILIPVLLFAVFGIPHSVPDEFIVPTEKVKCGDSMVIIMLKKGKPDEFTCERAGAGFWLGLGYDNVNIMGLEADCYYNFIGNDRVNNLSGIGYYSEPENFNRADFINTELKQFEESLGDKFIVKKPIVEEFDDGEYLYNYEYVCIEGNKEEHIIVYVSDDSVEIKIRFEY